MKHSFTRYYLVFAGVYFLTSIAFALLAAYVFQGANGTSSVITPFIAAMSTGSYFLKHEQRAPNVAERRRLIWGSFAIFFGFAVLSFGAAFLVGTFWGVSDVNAMQVVLSVIFIGLIIFVIVFFMISWAYGGLLSKQAEKLRAKDNTFD